MGNRALVVFLIAASGAFCGITEQRNAQKTLERASSSGQLVGTWRLVSRVVTTESLVRHFQVSADKLAIIVRTTSAEGNQIRTLNWERVR